MSRRVLLILNPTARAGRAAREISGVRSRLENAGCHVTLRETAGRGHATVLAAAAADAGEFEVIAAAGGDGTAREVCSGVLSSARPDQPVAIIPLGTGNDLAHVAGTGSLAAAVRAVTAGTPRTFDAIQVACVVGNRPVVTHAFCFAAVGLAADVVRLTTPTVKWIFGPRLCYSVGFFRALAGYRPVAAQVATDAGKHAGDYLLICAGNTARALQVALREAGMGGGRPARGESWRALLLTSGDLALLHASGVGATEIIRHLVMDRANPSSIQSSISFRKASSP